MKPLHIIILALVSFVAWCSVAAVRAVIFDQQCSGYLERAANANTVEIAVGEMTAAVGYLEKRGITSGYTSILYRTPDEDVGYWYGNLSASLAELRAIKAESGQLERSNVLMKLRETLIDNGESGDRLTAPSGITRFPNNTAFCLWGWGSFVLLIFGMLKTGFVGEFLADF